MNPAMTTRRRAKLLPALGEGASARLVSFSLTFLRAELQIDDVNGVARTLRFEGTQWVSGPASWFPVHLEVRYVDDGHRVEVFDTAASFLLRARVAYVLSPTGESAPEDDDDELVG